MKNINYFPFERNKYFYGKLLTVDDFETEQRYMNNKRRIINRFLYGTGVVCGMNVVTIDDTTISVEPGLALDFSGREIVIEIPDVKKLSMIDGFDTFLHSEDEKHYLYLCLDYEEREKEQVHNITGSNNEEYNKYQETYHLSATTLEPSTSQLSNGDFFETTKTIYMGNGIEIKQKIPKYVETGKEFELKIIIENMGQLQPIQLSYDLELTCLEYKGNHFIHISFDEESYLKSYQYEQVYYLKPISVKEAMGTLEVNKGSFELYVGKRLTEAKAQNKMEAFIINQDISETLIADYYKGAMEDIVKNNYQQSIYLAKLFVIKAGESYVIDSVKSMPFYQYIYNNVLSDIMNRLTIKASKELINKDFLPIVQSSAKDSNLAKWENSAVITTGYVIIDLGIGGHVGQRFFSADIIHNLGLGCVTILLGQCYETKEEGSMVYGSPEVFEDECTLRAELAAKLNQDKGSFQIGVRLIEPTLARYMRVEWTAMKDPTKNKQEKEEMALFIKPEILYLKTRESYYLEAVLKGVAETELRWIVKEDNSGSIEQNGKYTAPNLPGIYEVMVESKIYDNLRATVFIVVRDID